MPWNHHAVPSPMLSDPRDHIILLHLSSTLSMCQLKANVVCCLPAVVQGLVTAIFLEEDTVELGLVKHCKLDFPN